MTDLDGQRGHLRDGDVSNPCPTGAPFAHHRHDTPESARSSPFSRCASRTPRACTRRTALARPDAPACRAAGDPGHQSRNVTGTMVRLITHRHIYFAGTLSASPTPPSAVRRAQQHRAHLTTDHKPGRTQPRLARTRRHPRPDPPDRTAERRARHTTLPPDRRRVAGQAPASNTETRTSQGGENAPHKNPTGKMALPGIRRHHR